MGESIGKLWKWAVLCAFVMMGASCKTTSAIKGGAIDDDLTAKAVIRNHYHGHLNFKTLSGKMKIDYSDGSATQSVTVSFRMEKDKAIWLSAPLGIVKAYITPDRVSFYNKLDNEYFDGDFSYLSGLLGTDLDFEKVQNLLLGDALFDLRDEKYAMDIANNYYRLKPKSSGDLFKTLFQIEPINYKMASQQISQPWKNRLLEVNYKNYQTINKWLLPDKIAIVAVEGDHTNTISIEYRNMEFNRVLNFPYDIPNGFKKIALKEYDR